MGCILPPMPNHLSTHRSLPLNHIRVVRSEEMSGVAMVRLSGVEEKKNRWVGWSVDKVK